MFKDEEKLVVSVIVPLYNGSGYVGSIVKMIDENRKKLSNIELELIFVNDCPLDLVDDDSDKYTLLVNEKNRGIHYSRVRGLLHSKGKFVHFLDQDDIISENFYQSQINKVRYNSDVVVGNGIVQYKEYEKHLYRYYFMQWTVKKLWFYSKFDNRIISPGQCLIKKDSIPKYWIDNIMNNNGSDDAFLWWVLLVNKAHFTLNRESIYIHVNTDCNYSLDVNKMRLSQNEALELMKKYFSMNIYNNFYHLYNCNEKSKIVKIVEFINKK